jgi:hypothetical protein
MQGACHAHSVRYWASFGPWSLIDSVCRMISQGSSFTGDGGRKGSPVPRCVYRCWRLSSVIGFGTYATVRSVQERLRVSARHGEREPIGV